MLCLGTWHSSRQLAYVQAPSAASEYSCDWYTDDQIAADIVNVHFSLGHLVLITVAAIDSLRTDMVRKMDDGFSEVDRKMNEGFQEVDRKMNDGFREVDRKMNNINLRVGTLSMQFTNMFDTKSKANLDSAATVGRDRPIRNLEISELDHLVSLVPGSHSIGDKRNKLKVSLL